MAAFPEPCLLPSTNKYLQFHQKSTLEVLASDLPHGVAAHTSQVDTCILWNTESDEFISHLEVLLSLEVRLCF
jgi:hypothetical protein